MTQLKGKMAPMKGNMALTKGNMQSAMLEIARWNTVFLLSLHPLCGGLF